MPEPAAPFECPRQTHEAVLAVQKEHKPQLRADMTCSYCGSLSEEAFFEAVRAGAEIIPTDKDYKAYIAGPNPLAGKLGCFVSSTHPGSGLVLMDDALADTVTWKNPADREYMIGKYVKLSPHPANEQRKFYFQHLTPSGRCEFVDLYNRKLMKIGYPGHFYVRPYFVEIEKGPAS